jgi:signal transduction histidine kinase
MDGFAFYEGVRQRGEWTDIQFVFLTALDEVETLERAYRHGVDEYLIKSTMSQERLLLIIEKQLRRREEWLRHIRAQQTALERARRELTMMMSHELRTPLVSITMVSKILAEELSRMAPDQVQELLGMMDSGAVRLNRVVEQMVAYAQLRSGVLSRDNQAYFQRRYIHDLVAGAVRQAQKLDYRQRGIPICVEERDSDLTIRCDFAALQQALTELLINAMMFSQANGEAWVRQWVDGDRARITVSDKGIGIPSSEVARVFEPFYQYNRDRQEQQGIGIGLTLAKGIVEAHDGMIELVSHMGEGTEVTISLPLDLDSR